MMEKLSKNSVPMVKLTREFFFGFNVISKFGKLIKYDDKNLVELFSSMTEEDRKIFPCSERCPLVLNYMKETVKGVQKYLLRETENDLKVARKKVKMFFIVDRLLSALFWFVTYKILSIC